MFVLITYDVNTTEIEGQKRLRKVAKICLNYGHRVQNSVFECVITENQLVIIKNELLKIIDKELDGIRIYNLGTKGFNRIINLGKDTALDVTDVLIL